MYCDLLIMIHGHLGIMPADEIHSMRMAGTTRTFGGATIESFIANGEVVIPMHQYAMDFPIMRRGVLPEYYKLADKSAMTTLVFMWDDIALRMMNFNRSEGNTVIDLSEQVWTPRRDAFSVAIAPSMPKQNQEWLYAVLDTGASIAEIDKALANRYIGTARPIQWTPLVEIDRLREKSKFEQTTLMDLLPAPREKPRHRVPVQTEPVVWDEVARIPLD